MSTHDEIPTADLLTRNAILTADDLDIEDVPVPEWGGTVRVRTLTGHERDAFEVSLTTDDGKKDLADVRAKLVARSVVDKDGALLFRASDIGPLGMKSAAALNRVVEVAQRLSGLTSEDVEKLAGNSEAAPSGSSSTD